MISSSGEAAISAVNMVGSINVFLIQIFVAVGLGGTVLIAQYFGRGEHQMLGKVVNGTVFGLSWWPLHWLYCSCWATD